MSTKEKYGHYDDFKWTVENEICLFEAMTNHKLVGTNRYFNMALVLEKLSDMNKFIPVDCLWNHIKSMYDIDALSEMENVNVISEDFVLPSADFSELMKNRSANEEANRNILNRSIIKSKLDLRETPKIPKREEKIIPKIMPRRDSAFKESSAKPNTTPKTAGKVESEKKSANKSRSRKNSDISMSSPVPSNANRIGRSTRGSLKPEENNKRRTRTDLK